jgi:hypothetical protein
LCFKLTAQDISFDPTKFENDLKIAQWMIEYTKVKNEFLRLAREMSNVKTENSRVICVRDNKHRWHIYLKNYYSKNNNKDTVLHFLKSGHKIDYVRDVGGDKKSDEKIKRYFTALETAITDSEPIFNTLGVSVASFVDVNRKNDLQVKLLPSNMSKYYMLYGLELNYFIDEKGQKIHDERNYFSGGLKLMVLKEQHITLDYTDAQQTPVSAIYLAMLFKNGVESVTVNLQGGFSRLLTINAIDYAWFNNLDNR